MDSSKASTFLVAFTVGLLSYTAGIPSAIADQSGLPDLGDPSESALSVSKEREIGNEIMQQIREQRATVDDLMVQEYISGMGHKLVAQSDAAVHDFTFFVIHENGINAFALPGGYIGVNAGLIMAIDGEDELAAVMAHEISHVTQRHLARAFFHEQQLRAPVLAALLAAVLVGGEVGQAAVAAASAGSVQSQINFTRKHEQEADRVGIALLARAGYNGESMATLFEKMHQQAKLYGGAPPEFLSTHPVHASRIAEARARAQKFAVRHRPDSLSFRVARARVRVLLSNNPTKLASDLRHLLREGRTADEDMDRYAYAFALQQSGQVAEALEQINILLGRKPDVLAFQLLRSEVDMLAGRDEEALARLKKYRQQHPDDHVLTLEYARMLVHVGQAVAARKMLEEYLVYRKGDPNVYQLLSHASKAAGDSVNSHAYMAERFRLLGDEQQAISHLEAALRSPIRNYYQEAQLQAQLKSLRSRQDKEKQKK